MSGSPWIGVQETTHMNEVYLLLWIPCMLYFIVATHSPSMLNYTLISGIVALNL